VRQISVDGGVEPVWCQECGELFYRNGNQWRASAITLEPELSWEPPRLVFETDFIDTPAAPTTCPRTANGFWLSREPKSRFGRSSTSSSPGSKSSSASSPQTSRRIQGRPHIDGDPLEHLDAEQITFDQAFLTNLDPRPAAGASW